MIVTTVIGNVISVKASTKYILPRLNQFKMLISMLVFLLVFSPTLLGQNESSISGKVTDSNGKSLIGVNIMIKDSPLGTSTNEKGKFSIMISDKVFGEQVTIEAQSMGYVSKVIELDLNEKESSELTVSVNHVKGLVAAVETMI